MAAGTCEHLDLSPQKEAGSTLGMAGVSRNLKSSFQWHTTPNKITPPSPSQTLPPHGDQVFRHIGLWGLVAFKLPQVVVVPFYRGEMEAEPGLSETM